MIFNMAPEEWYSVVNPLLKGKYNTIKPATVLMRQQRYGRIVNFSAVSGLEGAAAQANFGAGMAGTVGLTRVVGRDMGRYGVTCNCIAVGQVADPEFIAPIAAWLCTDEAWNVNAKTFHVSGGEISGSSVSIALEEVFDRSVVKAGRWTIEELAAIVPHQLLIERANPAPPGLDIDVPGRPVPPPVKV
jgi:NAD(P)-dependent dehydrogenase (short-subunit alcohol dehydrogenase family)